MTSATVTVSCIAPVNIAVIKYWGKRDTQLNVPVNSSLSATIDVNAMRSCTTITASKEYAMDEMYLNGERVDIVENKRMMKVLELIRERARSYVIQEERRVLIRADEWDMYRLKIESENNFPTAAGLASSASGFACMTRCLASLYNVKEEYDGELTTIARQGSGSACRSLHGGFVKWEMGTKPDGSDSIGVQVASEEHWPEMRVIILVAGDGPKNVGSTQGMQRTVATSELIDHRARHVVPARMESMEKAIQNRDFATFAEITMKDSNQFHAVCLDTYPPIFYLNQTSKKIIHIVHEINKRAQRPIVAYTFDAGPNAVLYLLDEHVPYVYSVMLKYFLPYGDDRQSFVTDPQNIVSSVDVDNEVGSDFDQVTGTKCDGERVYRMIVAKVGRGATIVRHEHTFE